jgi:hypothetical protein
MIFIIIENNSGQSAVRMPVQATHHEIFSKHLHIFSVWSLHDYDLLIIERPEKFWLNPRKFQKVIF